MKHFSELLEAITSSSAKDSGNNVEFEQELELNASRCVEQHGKNRAVKLRLRQKKA